MKKYIATLPGVLLLAVGAACTSDEVRMGRDFRQIKDSVEHWYVPDRRVELFEAECYFAGTGCPVLRGATTSAGAKAALVDALRERGYVFTDSLQVCPDVLALEGKVYGIVNLSVCTMRSQADFSSEPMTQALLGMPVKLLLYGGWYVIQTPDGYIARVHRRAVFPVTKGQYNAWNGAEKIVVTSHYGFAYERPDRASVPVSDIVGGNRLRAEGTEGDFYRVSYPDGRRAYIPRGDARPEAEWRAGLKQDALSILRTARSLTGVPYLWAGTSSKGVDCSGFVRTVLFMHDIIVPRDASQQARVGRRIEAAADFSNLLPGDLLFFGRRAAEGRPERVVHVGIYMGAGRFIHSQGDVHVSGLDRGDVLFDAFNLNRFLFATRFLSSVNGEEGINTTLTNSFYLPQK